MAEVKKTPAAKKPAAPKTDVKAAKPAVQPSAKLAAAQPQVKTAPKTETPKTQAKKVYPQIKVTLIKSASHQLENHKRTIEALGLKKIGQSKIHNDIPATQGMIFKVKHLVKVEKI